MMRPARLLLTLLAMSWLAACGGGSSSSPSSSTSPPQSQEPTKPPLTTQPPTTAPPGTPGSTPSGSGSGSGGAFNQGTGFNAIVRTLLMAPDGSHDVYVGGDFTTYNGTPANHLIRLHPDGTVAQTFGQGFDQVVLALSLATDGSNALYASGAFTQFNGQPVPPLIRITPTGLRDSSFQPSNLPFAPLLFAVPEDGSRDVYALIEVNPPPPLVGFANKLVRLHADGTPNPTYAPATFVVTGDPLVFPVATIAVPPGSGKLYVAGSIQILNGETVSSLLRLNADGTLDTSFAQGTVPTSNPVTEIVETIAPARDGSGDLYAGGRFGSYNGTPVNGSMRVHDNGVVDTSYAQAVSLIPMGIWPAQDGTGDIFITGFSALRTFRFLRLDRTGALVSTFHEPTFDDLSGNIWVLSVVPVLDGTRDLYIGGSFTTYNGLAVNHIARIHADGSLASESSGS